MSAATMQQVRKRTASAEPASSPCASSVPSPAGAAAHRAGASPRGAPEAAIPLGQLLQQAAEAVRTGIPDATWIMAAVAAVKPARGGVSVELVEADASQASAGVLRCYMPEAVLATVRQRTGLVIEAATLVGMTAVVRVTVDLHPRWGLSGRIEALAPGVEVSLARRALEAAIDRLRRENLYDRQRRLAAPSDVTRVAVVHPAGAAGWADVEGELTRWQRANLIVLKSCSVPFEGAGAAVAIAAALRRAAEPLEGSAPDLLLLVRGGGAAASLTALDDQDLARVIAMLPIPLVAGLGHAVDLTLADRVAWRSADTPSKALGLLREHLVAPARRARANHAAILMQVSAGLDRAGPSLAAIERRVAAEVLRHAVAASEDLDNRWFGVRAAAGAACEHLARREDALVRLASDIAAAPAVILGRTDADLAATIAAVRAGARRASAGADDGAGHLAAAAVRAVALVETADAELAALSRGIPASVLSRRERAAHEIDAFVATIWISARDRLGRADDGARALTLITTTVAEMHRRQVGEIDRLTRAIETAVVRRIEAAAAGLERAAAVFDGADPARVLEHGYALVTDSSGKPVTSIATAKAASVLTLMLADGTIAVRVVDPQSPALGDPS